MSSVIASIVRDHPTGIICDVGGGTAATRALWPSTWTYVSVDPDPRMIDIDDVVQIDRRVGGADSLPVDDSFADVVLLQNMSHHLDDRTWSEAIREAKRVLKASGILVFMDAVKDDRRVISWLFWKLDAGHYPRPSETLEADISSVFEISEIRRFTLVHKVLLLTATP